MQNREVFFKTGVTEAYLCWSGASCDYHVRGG